MCGLGVWVFGGNGVNGVIVWLVKESRKGAVGARKVFRIKVMRWRSLRGRVF